ncbi:MAG TPA: hypothetical protein VFN10_14235 [Thermoanaerobaculia bacterium]|nr:hypothetical protein [Thermoanaerobaculia bacterium]
MRTAIALTVSLLAATAAFAADDVTHKFESSTPRGNVQRIVIDIPAGKITVRNSAAPQLRLVGVASRDYDGASEKAWAQKVVNDTSVAFYVNGPEAIVRRKFGPNADSWRAQRFTGIDVIVEVPAGVDVKFETSFGEVELNGTFGDIDLDLRAGEVTLTTPRAGVRELNASVRIGEVHTHIGGEVVSREGLFPGKTNYFNSAGKTHIDVHVTTGEVSVTLTP